MINYGKRRFCMYIQFIFSVQYTFKRCIYALYIFVIIYIPVYDVTCRALYFHLQIILLCNNEHS